MLEENSQKQLRTAIAQQVEADRSILEQLRNEVRPLRDGVRKIQPRATAAISIVATDGGNNQLRFDPFLVQLIRVVDSNENEYCLEAVSPTQTLAELDSRQFSKDGKATTALGEMMQALEVESLSQLSHMIRSDDAGRPRSPSWVQVYREIVEWAILYSLFKKDFGSDTLIVFDGLLRSKVFAGNYFIQLKELIQAEMERHSKNRRRIYLVGLAKSSKVFTRYRLAMKLEGVLRTTYPAFIEIPRQLEEAAYVWSEYARGDDRVEEGGEVNKFVIGKMYFVKFGNRPTDPIWPVDVFSSQVPQSDRVFGHLLNDAIGGFPVCLYPRSLQKAHENAALVDFDLDILQDQIFAAVRSSLGENSDALDEFQLQDSDPASGRYG